MPRRTSARALTSTSSTPHDASPGISPFTSLRSSNIVQLRQQWKWAAFSQFFFTFETLFAMNDVTLTDIEDDLTCSTNIFIPRVMQRLLHTLTQDRKISLDNWQTALRKQYLKREPEASPFGPEPLSRFAGPQRAWSSHHPSAEPQTEGVRTGDGVSRLTSPMSAILPAGEDGVDENGGRPSPQTHEHDSQHPIDNILETDNKSHIDWLDLPMLTKLDSMHTLVEWQFHNPLRLRTIMKDDDEGAEWRIEPLGYDAKGNAFWLIGADRLWIQSVPPKPTNLKRKRSAVSNGKAKAQPKSKGPPAKRQCTQLESSTQAGGRATRNSAQIPGSSKLGGRAAKLQANMKLDAQARELAEFRREVVGTSTTRTGMKPRTQRSVGTRLSARLRADIADEEWQPIPEEWLAEGGGQMGESSQKKDPTKSGQDAKSLLAKAGLDSDKESISDLTELSEDEDELTADVKSEYLEDTPAETSQQESVDDRGIEEPPSPEGFIEWETICVTLQEWEHIAERFQKATHYAEKALHKILVHSIIPVVTEELRDVDRKRRLEEAIVHRKRSSRIAIKESEKEEARTAARKKAEEAEKMSRARRLELRLQKEEADRERREAIREQRRKEREAKELLQKQEPNESTDIPIDVVGNGQQNGDNFQGKIQLNGVNGSGSRTPVGDDWELDCEVCRRRGINQDDGTPMMCCGMCSKWQHIICHDEADMRAGHQKRNWDIEEFICGQCRSRLSNAVGATQHYRMGQHNSHSAPQLPQNGFHATGRVPYAQRSVVSAPPKTSDDHTGVHTYPTPINGGRYGHEHEQLSHSRSTVTPNRPTQSQSYHSHSNIAFTHYQPDQRGFSSSQIRQPHVSDQPQTYHQNPPSLPPHLPQYPDPPTGSQTPALYPHTHNQRSAPHAPAMGWNTPPPTQTRSYPSYNGVTNIPTVTSGYSQERDTYTEQQWQQARLADQLPQFPAISYHQTIDSTFHAPFQTPR